MAKILTVHTGGEIGHTIFVPTASGPSYTLPCDGTSYLRTDYPALFAKIGVAHGSADGTHFNVPDYRGRALRHVDGGPGRDPDAALRTTMATGGNSGDNVGSVQGHSMQTHTHTQNSHSHNELACASGTGSPGNSSISRSANDSCGSPAASNASSTVFNISATATNQNASATGTFAQASANETRMVNANTKIWIVWK